MTDGNTATNISPVPSEDEMSKLREIFDRALNSIIAATELSKTVKDLRFEMDSLKSDLDRLRRNNETLDDTLSHVRGQRDQAQADLAQAREELHKAQATVNASTNDLNEARAVIDHLQTELAQVKKERDEYGLGQMQAQDEVSKLQKQLARVKEIFSDDPMPDPLANKSPAMQEAPRDISQDASSGASLSDILPKADPKPYRDPLYKVSGSWGGEGNNTWGWVDQYGDWHPESELPTR